MSSPNLETAAPPEQASLLDKIEILHTEEISGNLVAMAPVELVYQQDVPVDASHVMDLAASIKKEAEIKGGHGQLSPVLLAEIPGFDQFPIVDGFHRTPAVQSLGRTHVYATIRPNSSWDDVIDHRILAAITHRSVRFSRVVEWVEEAWNRTPWSHRLGSVSAFSLTFSQTMTGKNLGLQPEEVGAIKDWVTAKCDFWHLSPASIYKNLSIARTADPGLVHEARERRHGRELVALTPQHLGVVTKIFPKSHEMQRLLATVAKDHAMTVPKTRAAGLILAAATDMEDATRIVQETDWKSIEPVLIRPNKPFSVPAISPLEQTANANYLLTRLEETVIVIGETALRPLEGKDKDDPNNEALATKLRQIGHKCLDLAAEVEEVAGAKQAAPTNTSQNGNSRGPSYRPDATPRTIAIDKEPPGEGFEASITNFLEGGGDLSVIQTHGDIALARQVLRRQLVAARMSGVELDDETLKRRSEINLAIIEAERTADIRSLR